jgi:hypothetical protein
VKRLPILDDEVKTPYPHKCLVCGGYHGNLPCPKTGVTS